MVTGKRRARSGQLLGPILFFLSMLAILAYSVQGLMVEFAVLSHRLTLEEGAQSLAISGLSAGAARMLAGGTSEGGIQLDLASEIALLTTAYPGSTLTVMARLGKATTLARKDPADATERARLLAGRGYDPTEVRFPVTLSAEARWGNARRSLTEVREAAVVDVAPGTLGKFTLWARRITPEGADGFACGFDGQPKGRKEGRPLVLHNGGAAPEEPFSRDPAVHRRRGQVWLGGDPSLKMSAGYLGLGEAWTFLPMEELSSLVLSAPSGGADDRSPPVYVDAEPPDFFRRNYPPPQGDPPPFQRFEIRHMLSGWYAGADERGRKLADLFPGEPGAEQPGFGTSSRLHLFGTAEVPSPTLVLGRVRRRYPAVSAVLVDREEDGTPDGLVGLLPRLAGTFPRGMPPVPQIAPSLTAGTAGVEIDNEADVTWENMFESASYATYASQIEERPYMEAYSFLYRTDDGKASFYPAPPLFDGFVEELALGDAGQPFYRGRPEVLAAEDLLEKATYAVEDPDELTERFIARAGELELGAVVEVRQAKDGVLRLSGLTVKKGGMIVLSGPGDIVVSELSFDRAEEASLVLVALQGDVRITIGDETDPLPISVIAPRGRLKLAGSGPLALEGSLVVDTLDLEQLPEGGNLYYDSGLDPTSSSRRDRYRVLFSDASLSW